MAQYDYMDYGIAYDPEEERKRREEAAKKAGETPVAKTETTVYEDGSKTHTTTKEEPAPSFVDRLGQAFSQAGTNFMNNVQAAPGNFVNNLNRGFDNLRQAPERFVQNAQAIPGQMQQRLAPVAPDYTTERNDAAAVDAQMRAQGMPAQPVAPAPQTAAPAPQTAAPAPQTAAPAFNQQQYNASVGAQESGNRANIGYHNRAQGTAYGQFGLTDAAWQDARRLNPNLPADKTQATPEQQTAAMNAFTQQNARYLQGYGIQPTQNTLAAAHFLGAKGLADYLRDGTISKAAADANGGEERVRQIVNARLGGQAAAASGATGRPTAVPGEGVAVATGAGVQGTTSMRPPAQAVSPYSLSTGVNPQGLGTAQQRTAPAPQPDQTTQAINYYQSIQDKPDELFKFAFNPNAPDYLKQRARDQIAEQYDQQKKLAQAKEELPTLTAKQTADAIQGRNKSGVGDWLQYLLFKHVGLNDLANEKAEELGIGHTWQNATVTDEKGNERSVEVLTTANGRVLKGNYAGTDTPISKAQLEEATGGILGKGVHVTKVENRINPQTGEVVHVQTLSNGQEKFKLGGKPYAGDKTVLIPEAQHTKQEDTRVNAGYNKLKQLTANPTPQQTFQALRDAGVPPARIERELGLPAGSLSRATPTSVTAPTTTAPAQAPATAVGGAQPASQRPVQQPGEYDKDYKTRLDAWENKTKLQQKDAEAFANVAVNTRSQLEQIRQAVDVVKGGNYFMGPLLGTSGSKILPGMQEFFASKFGDQASTDNTRMLRSLLTREGLQGIKNSMGPSISNFDVQAWLKSNPVTEQSSPQALQNYFTKLHNTLYDLSEQKRKTAVEQGMLEPSFSLGTRIETGGGEVDYNNPLLKKKK